MIIKRKQFSSKKSNDKEDALIVGGLGTSAIGAKMALGERKAAINSAILTHLDSKGINTTDIRRGINTHTKKFKPEIIRGMEERMRKTGGSKANEKNVREAIKMIENSGKKLNGTQRKVLLGMKETVSHLKGSRYAKNAALIGAGVAGVGMGIKAVKNKRSQKS